MDITLELQKPVDILRVYNVFVCAKWCQCYHICLFSKTEWDNCCGLEDDPPVCLVRCHNSIDKTTLCDVICGMAQIV